MKRAREEKGMGTQLKRRSDDSGTHQSSEGQQKLTTDDALTYLRKVKEMFNDNREKYDEFLEVMKAFKAQRVDTAGVIARVKDLFKGHRSLILGFNAFLPKGYEITIPEECTPRKQPVDYQQAIDYVNKIKTRFQNEEEVYKNFLNILNLYRQGKKTIQEVYHEVEILFGNHPDLLHEFSVFLPDASSASRPSVLPLSTKPPSAPISRGSQKDNPVKTEKNVTAPSNHPLNATIKDEKTNEMENEQHKVFGKEKEQGGFTERREKDRSEKRPTSHRDQDMDAMCNPSNKRKSARRMDEPISKHTQAGQSGVGIGKQLSQVSSREEKKLPVAFFQKAKHKLGPGMYQDFLRCVNIYNDSIINIKQLQRLVVDIFGKYPDLMDEFNDICSRLQSNDFDSCEEEFTKIIKLEKSKERDGRSERELEENERPKELDHERDRERDKDKYHKGKDMLNKPVSELDLSNSESCTPSYRLLPKNYVKSIASFRTDLASEVLNDDWVSVTSGSEDYSFKHMRRNQYEESLFSCEDDRFELDMLIECTASTIKNLNEMLKRTKEATFQVDKHCTAINRRCIERIYGDHGLEAVEQIRKDPIGSLPIILKRLKQKCEEWEAYRDSMNKVWADVYAKNYSKSLDHRSFYFKQQDRRNLSTKALLQEIKELQDKKRREDDILLAIVGNRRPVIPHLQHNYPDVSIHEDLYKIIKYSIYEVYSITDHAEKIVRVWTVFLEHMLGVPPHPDSAEDTEEMSSDKNPFECVEEPAEIDTKKITSTETPFINAARESAVAEAENMSKEKVSIIGYNVNPTEQNWHEDWSFSENQAGQFSRNPCPTSMDITDSDKNNTLLTVAPSLKVDSRPGQPSSEDASGTIRYAHGLTEAAAPISRNSFPLMQDSDKHLPKMDRHFPTVFCKSITSDYRIMSHEKEQCRFKVEKEDGELSPIRSPANLLRDGESLHCDSTVNLCGKTGISVQDEKIKSTSYKMRVPDSDTVNGAESPYKSGDCSENAFAAAEEVSGSESANEDECSHDDNEEEADNADNEGKAESEGEAEVAEAHDNEEADSFAFLDRSLQTAKPLSESVISTFSNNPTEKDNNVFYGNDAFYILFRLHQTLYDRILAAKANSLLLEQNGKDTPNANVYTKFLSVLYTLLDGSIDNAKFEDECRAIIGTQSYVLFTLDRLISKLVKQLQVIACDEISNKLLRLQYYERLRSPSRFCDAVYHANACAFLNGENVYRFEFLPAPCQLTIQLMDGPEKIDGIPNALEPSFSSYLYNEFLSEVDHMMKGFPIFRRRNRAANAGNDDSEILTNAMEGVIIVNGLEYKISCNTSKASYVLDTEDFLYNVKRKRKNTRKNGVAQPSKRRKCSMFHSFLESALRSE